MKKTIYTLNIENYEPQVSALTFPLLKHYAEKIGAEMYVIEKRWWPEYDIIYEKFQVWTLMYERNDDWAYYIDTDALIHPDMFDVTNHLHKDTVCQFGTDMAGNRWRYDEYFMRDGRHLGAGNWFSVVSDWCRDYWHPLEDISYEQAVERIYPQINEVNLNLQPAHFIDDFLVSRNMARYGLKHTTIKKIKKDLGDEMSYTYHHYGVTTEEKLNGFVHPNGFRARGIIQALKDWKVA